MAAIAAVLLAVTRSAGPAVAEERFNQQASSAKSVPGNRTFSPIPGVLTD